LRVRSTFNDLLSIETVKEENTPKPPTNYSCAEGEKVKCFTAIAGGEEPR
jgi:hypothetical protein